jgi:hypothetical protein
MHGTVVPLVMDALCEIDAQETTWPFTFGAACGVDEPQAVARKMLRRLRVSATFFTINVI